MALYSFLLNCFTHPTYEFNSSFCENGEHDNQTDTEIDLWEFLILFQRILILLYKLLKRFKLINFL